MTPEQASELDLEGKLIADLKAATVALRDAELVKQAALQAAEAPYLAAVQAYRVALEAFNRHVAPAPK